MDREKSTHRPTARLAEGMRAALRRLPAYVYLEDLLRGRHIIEVGSGEGLGAYQLARLGAASVMAIERNSTAVEAARTRYRQANLTFIAGDYAAIDLGDQAVDVVCVPAGEEL